MLLRALPGGVVAGWAPAWTAGLAPVGLHLLVVGWLTQLVFGVAWWMFPRRRRSVGARGAKPAWVGWALLNAGLLLRAAAEPVVAATGPGGGWGAALALSAGLQWLAVVLFAGLLWPRAARG